MYKIKKRCR